MIRKTISFLTLLLAFSPLMAFDQSHKKFTNVLKQINENGLINYKALKANPTELNLYLSELNTVTRADTKKWTTENQIAFWINAYNAYTLKAIIDNYPIKSSFLKSALYPKNSIRQIDGVWDKLKFDVTQEKLTLNHMEHEILRKEFNEPRIHMALVCAALSCPPLLDEAYTGKKLENQLRAQSKQFVGEEHRGVKIDQENKVVYVSSIFDWFGEDFIPSFKSTSFKNKNETEQAVLSFVHTYATEAQKKYLKTGTYPLKYLKYDWTLNEQ